jgi:hypothetical protein
MLFSMTKFIAIKCNDDETPHWFANDTKDLSFKKFSGAWTILISTVPLSND